MTTLYSVVDFNTSPGEEGAVEWCKKEAAEDEYKQQTPIGHIKHARSCPGLPHVLIHLLQRTTKKGETLSPLLFSAGN
jgi:hypothetical protein